VSLKSREVFKTNSGPDWTMKCPVEKEEFITTMFLIHYNETWMGKDFSSGMETNRWRHLKLSF
jgi:hypothetical protein